MNDKSNMEFFSYEKGFHIDMKFGNHWFNERSLGVEVMKPGSWWHHYMLSP